MVSEVSRVYSSWNKPDIAYYPSYFCERIDCVNIILFGNWSGFHVKWGPFHHDMCLSWVADWRDGLRIRRVAGKMLNTQSHTPDNGWYYRLGVGQGANNSL